MGRGVIAPARGRADGRCGHDVVTVRPPGGEPAGQGRIEVTAGRVHGGRCIQGITKDGMGWRVSRERVF
jgi:hypothetical protein